MSYEAAREVLSRQIAELQNQQDSANKLIETTELDLERHRNTKAEIADRIKETAAALQALGGPVPDWTDDVGLIAFWDEVKEGAEE